MNVIGVVPGQGWLAVTQASVEPVVAWVLMDVTDERYVGDPKVDLRAVTQYGVIDLRKDETHRFVHPAQGEDQAVIAGKEE
jgi:hypothetical protein